MTLQPSMCLEFLGLVLGLSCHALGTQTIPTLDLHQIHKHGARMLRLLLLLSPSLDGARVYP